MRTTIAAVIVMLLFLFTGSAGRAQEASPLRDEPYSVDLQAGETFKVCLSGQIACPAITPICDDVKVVLPVDTPDGLGFKGVGPGTTLCSAASATGQRRVFRFTVR
jgi:hypothetical protein